MIKFTKHSQSAKKLWNCRNDYFNSEIEIQTFADSSRVGTFLMVTVGCGDSTGDGTSNSKASSSKPKSKRLNPSVDEAVNRGTNDVYPHVSVAGGNTGDRNVGTPGSHTVYKEKTSSSKTSTKTSSTGSSKAGKGHKTGLNPPDNDVVNGGINEVNTPVSSKEDDTMARNVGTAGRTESVSKTETSKSETESKTRSPESKKTSQDMASGSEGAGGATENIKYNRAENKVAGGNTEDRNVGTRGSHTVYKEKTSSSKTKSGNMSPESKYTSQRSDGTKNNRPGVSSSTEGFQVIAFGDFGELSDKLVKTMEMYHSKFKSPDAVFLLGDYYYGNDFSEAKFASLFNEHVAGDSRARHYAILGNYDYRLEIDNFFLSSPPPDPRWYMPQRFYFERFSKGNMNVCVWFLDTDKMSADQASWLDGSISAERATCTWLIVNGHHPGMVQASGPTFGNKNVDSLVQPILDKYNVHIYMCGHHHNSQHITNLPHKTNVFVVGHVATQHTFNNRIVKGQLVWGNDQEPAILELNMNEETITFAFHSGYTGRTIHHGVITH